MGILYSDQLLDPRWQKKRLDILNRDNFTCRKCLSKDKTLHVHHTEYIKGRMAWDYENYYLKTLCADCHHLEELLKKQKEILIRNFKLEGYIIDFPCHACGNTDILSVNINYIKCTVCGYEKEILSHKDIEHIKYDNIKYEKYLCQE